MIVLQLESLRTAQMRLTPTRLNNMTRRFLIGRGRRERDRKRETKENSIYARHAKDEVGVIAVSYAEVVGCCLNFCRRRSGTILSNCCRGPGSQQKLGSGDYWLKCGVNIPR